MNKTGINKFHKIASRSLHMEWTEIPWDTLVMGSPVIQINQISVRGTDAKHEIGAFEQQRDEQQCKFVSCRLPHEQLEESMLLEDLGFRFIEVVNQPFLDLTSLQEESFSSDLIAELATSKDLPEVLNIAGNAFRNERYHADPRLSSKIGNERYRNWARASLDHKKQQLYIIRDKGNLVAFFILEMLPDGTCYWHLNAVAPQRQGQGYGYRSWAKMINLAIQHGASCIRSSIVARNTRVLNLYALLGFKFNNPLMTFHWVRQKK